MKLFYAMQNSEKSLDIYIYGDITSWPYLESDVSSYWLSAKIAASEADEINVYINSYGGEVAEALAIYNVLKRHKAYVRTYCDGLACSAASVIFMAGDERIMNVASLLMIHHAWCDASGNAEKLRKTADDLDAITAASIKAYRAAVNISEEQLAQLLANETWISPAEAVSMGFATAIEAGEKTGVAAASVRGLVMAQLQMPRSSGKPLSKTASGQVEKLKPDLPPANGTEENKMLNLLARAMCVSAERSNRT